jgi:ribosomal protein S18 acetylase RimI-like enzyme
MVTQVNPEWLDPSSYLAFLNRVFPGQWDRSAQQWYLQRAFNGRESDLLVQTEGATIVAGVGVCYRQVSLDEGPPLDVAVLCSAATLPEERGRGRYAELVQTALQCCHRNACVALLAFVTADNASGRGLLRLGARAKHGYYIAAAGGASVSRTLEPCSMRALSLDAAAAELARVRNRRVAGPRGPLARFHYAKLLDWRRQFIHRPHEVRALRLAHDSIALVESVGSTDRLQYLHCTEDGFTASIGALAAASAAATRGFFMYTLDPAQAAVARQLGLTIRDGYLMLQPTGQGAEAWEKLTEATWQVQSGDRV